MVFFRQVAHDCPVYFGDFLFVFLEHFVQTGQRFAGAGKNDHSADGAVHPVRNAQIYLSRLVVFFLDVCLDFFTQGRVAGFVRLDDVRVFFVDGYDVVVFV